MNRKSRRAQKASGAATPVGGAADRHQAEQHYQTGNAELLQERFSKAVVCYRRAIKLAPGFPEAHNNLGVTLQRQGRTEEAILSLRQAIALRAGYADAHNNLGTALLALGHAEESVTAFRDAIAAGAARPEACHNNLGNVLAQLGRGKEAVTAYRTAISLRPQFPEALNNLCTVLCDLGRSAEAVAASRAAILLHPILAESHFNLGTAWRQCERPEMAIAAFRRAAALQPGDADTVIALANLLQRRDQTEEGQRLFRRAHRLRPLSKRAGTKAKADFSVLLLAAPGVANTPSDYLIGRSGYDSYFLSVMAGIDYDLPLLRNVADVVVNLICDADQGRGILPQAIALVEALGRPTVNHPRRIQVTGREAVARLLADIPRCRMPRTVRLAAAALAAPRTREALDGFSFPLLVRLCGAHGGDDLEKLDDLPAVAAFADRHPHGDLYVTDYVPYDSADGYFRKYRLIFVDGRILPYHLAIDNQWKVHHFRTEMASQAWMRREEEAFVADPARVFDAGHWDTLRAIRDAVGLDYSGIDCSFDHNGNILVFEVNASMLVHGETSTFAYKEPYIARIKEACDAMLVKAAGRAVVQATANVFDVSL